jgi:hypothetical protein
MPSPGSLIVATPYTERKSALGLGSIDLTAAARSVLLAGWDPDDHSRRAIAHIKSNLAPEGPAVGYTINEQGFLWTGPSDLTAARILAADSEVPSAITEATEFLQQVLVAGPLDPQRMCRGRLSGWGYPNGPYTGQRLPWVSRRGAKGHQASVGAEYGSGI